MSKKAKGRKERIQDSLNKHPGWTAYRHAHSLKGITVAEIKEDMEKRSCRPVNKGEDVTNTKRTKRIDEIIAPHDVVGMALSIVSSISRGEIMEDEDLRKELGVGDSKWRRARGSTRLAGFWYQMPDKSIVWGQKPTITMVNEKMKEIL